nr:MAG TPA: hypothetical protein [Caudoviricetes sp.]
MTKLQGQKAPFLSILWVVVILGGFPCGFLNG